MSSVNNAESRRQQQSILHMLHFQYNYNASTVLTVRDRFCHAFFIKLSQCYSRNVPTSARKTIEYTLLILAILCSITLSYMHIAFVKSPIVCLDHVSHLWPHDGILRVEVLRGVTNEPHSLERSYLKELALQHNLGMKHFKMSEIEKIMSDQPKDEDFTFSLTRMFRNAVVGNERKENEEIDFSIPKDLLGLSNRSVLLANHEGNFSKLEEMRMTLKEFEKYRKNIWPSEEAIVEFSLDYGMLRLAAAARNRLNVPVHLVTLNADSDKCFGAGVSRFVLRNFVGYNDLLMGSLKRLAETEDNKGYVKNVISGEHFRFVSMWTTRTSYLTAGVIMLVFTLSISLLMRYTHNQVFALIVDVIHFLEFNTGRTFRTAPLFIVLLALVGMEAIMSEFFNDSSTAFAIIFIVWLADHFYAICCQTAVSKTYWPRFFFLHHFLFYAYDYRFNGQYSGLALLTSFLYIVHSMVYFYHRFELPAIAPEDQTSTNQQAAAATAANLLSEQSQRQTPSSPDQGSQPAQQTQFVISARVTVTRRMESTPSLPQTLIPNESNTREENNLGITTQTTEEIRSDAGDEIRNQGDQTDANRTRKLSSSSAEASSCGCCSSNDHSDHE